MGRERTVMAEFAQTILAGILFCLAGVGHVLAIGLLLAATYPLVAVPTTIVAVYVIAQLARR